MNAKTITEATKGGTQKKIFRTRLGWVLPPEEGRGSYIDGTGAYADCVAVWKSHGWDVRRVPNPSYKPRHLFSF